MKIYTLLGKDEIEAAAENHAINPGARSAQKILAHEVTALVHGRDRTESVMRVTEVLFGGGDVASLSDADLDALAAEIPVGPMGQTVVSLLVEAGLASSNGDARRLLKSGAISRNGEKIFEDIVIDDIALLKKGKNSFLLVR